MEKSKDTGWSWVVLFGVFVVAILSVGFHQSIGVFFVDWQEDFGISTQAVGWTSSVSMGGFAISGKTSKQSTVLYFALNFSSGERKHIINSFNYC